MWNSSQINIDYYSPRICFISHFTCKYKFYFIESTVTEESSLIGVIVFLVLLQFGEVLALFILYKKGNTF